MLPMLYPTIVGLFSTETTNAYKAILITEEALPEKQEHLEHLIQFYKNTDIGIFKKTKSLCNNATLKELSRMLEILT